MWGLGWKTKEPIKTAIIDVCNLELWKHILTTQKQHSPMQHCVSAEIKHSKKRKQSRCLNNFLFFPFFSCQILTYFFFQFFFLKHPPNYNFGWASQQRLTCTFAKVGCSLNLQKKLKKNTVKLKMPYMRSVSQKVL